MSLSWASSRRTLYKERDMKRLVGILIIAFLLLGLTFMASLVSGTGVQAAFGLASNKTSINNAPVHVDSKDFYRFFRDDTVKTLTISITDEEWQGMVQDMASMAIIDDRMRTGNYRKADLTYEDKDGKVTLENVGIRTKGNTTRILPQDNEGYHRAHFKIKFNETFDMEADSEAFKELAGRSFMSLDAVILKANLWNDPSFVHEKYAYDLLEEAGAKVPKISMTRLVLKIGDKTVDYGVYSMIEPVDNNFLEKRYDNDKGNLYKCLWQNFGAATLEQITQRGTVGIKDWTENYRPAYDLKTNKANPDHSPLLTFIDELNSLEGEALKAYLEENFEVDSFLKYMAMNMLLGMPDDYWAMGNNYYLYFDPQGKIEFIPYDYDQCLGSGWDGSHPRGHVGIATANILTWNNTVELLTGQPSSRPLVDKILSIDQYKQQYLTYLKEYASEENNLFSYSRFLHLFDTVEALYGPFMENDTQESSNMTLTNEQWYFETKLKSVASQLAQLGY